jgi:serine/threonine protein kinase
MASALFDRLRRETVGGRSRAGLPGYELGRLVAAGSGGEVYLARQLGAAQRTVALKRLAPGADSAVVARLQREGEILASLDHPHIVRIYELVPDGDSVAIAMQYALGGSLADRLARHGRLSPAQVVALASRCADALASAHRRGVLHRDVKPANILFTSDGEPLLSDFGIARWGGASGLTMQGMTLGTAGYIDPEVVDGGEPSVRSDVYSLGVVCYEALVGRPPFRGVNELAVMKAADRGEFVALGDACPGVAVALAAVVERAMARAPGERFGDAAELARALRGVRLELSSAAGATEPAAAPSPAVTPAPPPVSSPKSLELAPTGLFGPRPPEPPAPKRRRFPRLRRPRLRRPHFRCPRRLRLSLRAVRARMQRGRHRRALVAILVVAAGFGVYAARPSRAARPSLEHAVCPAAPLGGCDVQATLSGNVIELRAGPGRPATRFDLGQAGDIALLGDWQCRGNFTPAIYRPSTGQVFVFDGWANPDRSRMSSSTAAAIPNGRPTVVRSPAGCDHIEVRPN